MADSFPELIALSPTGDGTWTAEIPDGWGFMGIPNGGLVSSIMATAVAAATGRPDPITSTAHFLRPARPGPATLTTATIRRGRSLTTVRAELQQEDRVVAHLVGSLGELAEATSEPRIEIELPPLPPPEQCIGTDETAGFEPPAIARRVNLRLHPDHVGFATGAPSGRAEVSGWADIPFGSPTTLMPLIADAFPPPFFNTGEFVGPLPTIELTVHTHARPAPGPVAARFRTDYAGTRYLEEDGWISDSAGRLIAVSRQIAVFPG